MRQLDQGFELFMNREDNLAKSTSLLARLAHEIKVKNAAGLFDINRIAEDFFVPILSILYDCPELKNQNAVAYNFPAVDLGCEAAKVSIQVTSDASSAKVEKTLRLFEEHKLNDRFDTVYVLVLTEKQGTYSSRKLKEQIAELPIAFEPDNHIIDYRDLAARLGALDSEKIKAVTEILINEFAKQDASLAFRKELENFLTVAQAKIEFEKKSKKYIPSIFIETSSAKEQVRFFAHPLFFHRKIRERFSKLKLTELNELLRLAKQNPIDELPDLATLSSDPTNLDKLAEALSSQTEALQALRSKIAPMSMDRGNAERYEPTEDADAYSRIWRHPVESRAYGFNRRLDDILELIDLGRKKILLLTGMAGQGKTNFVCDLVENMFRKFQIPSIFIPARELNGYQGQARIFDFIANNRYAPSVQNLHGLLKLFDEVARENGMPFIIVVDGINEVSDFSGFSQQINDFLSAIAQYDHIKAIITCRSEFFDQRYASMLQQDFSDQIFHVENLRSEMSERHKDRLIEAYFDYFKIALTLGKEASDFLRNDLLLLRIFCEIEEGAEQRFVPTIYKGDVFERFLVRKVGEFEDHLKAQVVPVLHKVVSEMIRLESFSSLSTSAFDSSEASIIERLISDDIILRSELPEASLATAGQQNISFTYDELRDFILAHYIVTDLADKAVDEVSSILAKLADLQVREGVFRYTYILARKHGKVDLVQLCETQPDFAQHFVNNIELISPEMQNDADRDRVRDILSSQGSPHDVRAIAVFLFHRRVPTEVLNIDILINHINALDDDGCRQFFTTIFATGNWNWQNDWRREIGRIVSGYLERAEEHFPPKDKALLTFMLQISGYADWEFLEPNRNRFTSLMAKADFQAQRDYLANACSSVIVDNAAEIWAFAA